jgi:hypothetical protein
MLYLLLCLRLYLMLYLCLCLCLRLYLMLYLCLCLRLRLRLYLTFSSVVRSPVRLLCPRYGCNKRTSRDVSQKTAGSIDR